VALNHTVAVRVVERARHLGSDLHRIRDRELLLAPQAITQRLALHVGHHVVRGSVHLAAVDETEDVRMLQRRDGLDLAQEPCGADDRGELGPQHFDRDLALVLEIVREVHRSHAALAELVLDPVAAAEGCGESVSHDVEGLIFERDRRADNVWFSAPPGRRRAEIIRSWSSRQEWNRGSSARTSCGPIYILHGLTL